MGEAFTLPQCRDQSPFTSYAYQSSPIELELLTLNVGRLLQVFLNPSTPAFPLSSPIFPSPPASSLSVECWALASGSVDKSVLDTASSS